MPVLKVKTANGWVAVGGGVTSDSSPGAGGGSYILPVATQDTLGGVSIGEGIDITPEGKISVKTSLSPAESVLYTAQELTEEQKAQARQNIGAGTSNFSGKYADLTDKPKIPDAFTLSPASATELGGIKVGAGLKIADDGTLSISVASAEAVSF